MPNPFHLRNRIDNLWRRSGEHNPGYIRVKALDTIVRELYAANDRARLNQQMYFTTDPFDVARHLLRDLYDRTSPSFTAGFSLPPPDGGGRCLVETEGGLRQEELPPDEDDDPL